MNFIDSYDVSNSSPSTPTQESQSLNEEVTQVVGQLSKLWGGFRKQSQTAFEAARKDIGQLASQAQKEINKLTTEPSASSPSTTSEDTLPTAEPEAEPSIDTSGSTFSDTPAATGQPSHARNTSQNLFSRLQSSLPPNLVSTVQSQIPDSIKQSATSIDFNQIRNTLTTEFHRVQDITVNRSEGFLRDAQEFLKDAVKVVPPEEGGGTVAPAGVLWDGMDVWMLPEAGSPISDTKGKGKQREGSSSSGRGSAEGLQAVATRAQALLKQLRHDPEVIKVDPTSDERLKEMFESWIREFVDSKEGGINGSEWTNGINSALQDSTDGEALKATRNTLVPSMISADIFWTRYFFRVHQVEREEERRKALLQDTSANDDEFSWEDDEEEPSSPRANKMEPKPAQPSIPDVEPVLVANSTHEDAPIATDGSPSDAQASRRQSSEASYDVVSSQVSNAGDSKPEPKDAGDDDDSDWE